MEATLSGDELALRRAGQTSADPCQGWVPSVHYEILLKDSEVAVGEIDVRLGYTLALARYGGNLGYIVKPEFRGHHYAGKACRIARQIAVAQGMDVLWITCNPDNWPSRKTCEWIGATLVEIVDLPPENDQYARGERQKCRYRWTLY